MEDTLGQITKCSLQRTARLLLEESALCSSVGWGVEMTGEDAVQWVGATKRKVPQKDPQRRHEDECGAAWTPGTDEHDDAYGQIAVVLCESNFARLSPLPPLSSSSSRRRRRRRRRSSQAAALCFQLWPVWASLIQPTRPLAGSIWASPSVSSSDQICVRPLFSPGHLLAWYSGRTDSSRSGQTAMCKPCRVGTGWAHIAHGAKVWTENSAVARVNLGPAHLCKRTIHLAAVVAVVLHSPDLSYCKFVDPLHATAAVWRFTELIFCKSALHCSAYSVVCFPCTLHLNITELYRIQSIPSLTNNQIFGNQKL